MLLTFLSFKFLSTLSLRRATTNGDVTAPHASISIHALLAESDSIPIFGRYYWVKFLSTLSLRRATTMAGAGTTISRFLSTLSLRRATPLWLELVRRFHDFYPRSPCGERPNSVGYPANNPLFLSTLSLRRATNAAIGVLGKTGISIHALLAESDFFVHLQINMSRIFLSTLSLRRATQFVDLGAVRENISIHALLAESDEGIPVIFLGDNPISIHALLAESDLLARK